MKSLQALEKISNRHASACLRGGALVAVLSFLDFFSTGVKVKLSSSFVNILLNMECSNFNHMANIIFKFCRE